MPLTRHICLLSLGMLAGLGALPGVAQGAVATQAAPAQAAAAPAQPGAAAPARLIGTVTAIAANSLTVKLEIGGEATVAIGAQTRIVRAAPGEKNLSSATPIHLEDIAKGDRVLLRAMPGADATHYTAMIVVAMKQADIAQVHATQSEDWQRRGVGGVVKSVDPIPAGAAAASAVPGATIAITTSGRTLSIHVTPATTIRRYAADSVNFADAKPATLSEIQPGDQLRARGDRSPDGADVSAVEIVAGSFRNVAGTITTIDPAKNTLTVTDLSTKKPITLHLTADTQMRKLPPEIAQRLAARKAGPGDHADGRAGGAEGPGSGSSGLGGSGGQMAPGGPGSSMAGARGDPPFGPTSGPSHTAGSTSGAGPNLVPGTARGVGPSNGPGMSPDGPGGDPGQVRRGGGGDPAAMLQRAPAVTLAELKKGDAVMIVASRNGGGADGAATAITLIAGVEPLLESSSSTASQNLFSASWNLSGGGGAEAAAP